MKERKATIWIRWLFGVVVAVLVAIFIFNVTIRNYAVDSCQRRQIVFTELAGLVGDIANVRWAEYEKTHDIVVGKYALAQYARRVRILNQFVDCERKYPSVLGLNIH